MFWLRSLSLHTTSRICCLIQSGCFRRPTLTGLFVKYAIKQISTVNLVTLYSSTWLERGQILSKQSQTAKAMCQHLSLRPSCECQIQWSR
jgi:hypothetical protein